MAKVRKAKMVEAGKTHAAAPEYNWLVQRARTMQSYTFSADFIVTPTGDGKRGVSLANKPKAALPPQDMPGGTDDDDVLLWDKAGKFWDVGPIPSSGWQTAEDVAATPTCYADEIWNFDGTHRAIHLGNSAGAGTAALQLWNSGEAVMVDWDTTAGARVDIGTTGVHKNLRTWGTADANQLGLHDNADDYWNGEEFSVEVSGGAGTTPSAMTPTQSGGFPTPPDLYLGDATGTPRNVNQFWNRVLVNATHIYLNYTSNNQYLHIDGSNTRTTMHGGSNAEIALGHYGGTSSGGSISLDPDTGGGSLYIKEGGSWYTGAATGTFNNSVTVHNGIVTGGT